MTLKNTLLFYCIIYACLCPYLTAFSIKNWFHRKNDHTNLQHQHHKISSSKQQITTNTWLKQLILLPTIFSIATVPVYAGSPDLGANDVANSKILKGGASTLQQGISKVRHHNQVTIKKTLSIFLSRLHEVLIWMAVISAVRTSKASHSNRVLFVIQTLMVQTFILLLSSSKFLYYHHLLCVSIANCL